MRPWASGCETSEALITTPPGHHTRCQYWACPVAIRDVSTGHVLWPYTMSVLGMSYGHTRCQYWACPLTIRDVSTGHVLRPYAMSVLGMCDSSTQYALRQYWAYAMAARSCALGIRYAGTGPTASTGHILSQYWAYAMPVPGIAYRTRRRIAERGRYTERGG
eukprot:1326487-Rhodomonas_salina.4